MYLMQTVSAVPRARTAVHMDTKSTYVNSTPINAPNYIKQADNGVFIGYESRGINENGFKPTKKEEILNDRNMQRNMIDVDAIRVENEDDEKDKKKERKWTLGGFFRRKCKKDADDSSDDSGDERKKGFLSRRKSKRDRRKSRGKSSANGFDVIIPQQKDQCNGVGKTAEELWSGSPKNRHKTFEVPVNNNVIHNDNSVNNNGPVRYIYRHQNNTGSPVNKESLHVPRQSRRDSNLSRNSSGGSGSLDGRKGRKEVMARAEAKRDQMREESSSDENESYHSNSSLNRLEGCRRMRNSRHKRLSRDEENLIIKSDLEDGRRLPPHCRWISRTYYPDSSDYEKFHLMNHSATPSPARSPRVRQKQLLHNASSVPLPNSYPVSTFPPGVHYQQTRGPPPPPLPNIYTNQKFINAKEAQIHGSQPLLNYRNVNYKNRNSEYIHNIPRSNSEHSTNRKTLMDYEQFLSACGSNREKSLSYDQDIHRASYFENDPDQIMHVQLPIARAIQPGEIQKENQSPRGVRRIPHMNHYYDHPQHTLRSYENGMTGNRIDSTSSLPIPYQPIDIVQRSASGNSFCNLYENSKEAYYNQNRSSSYQHIPTYMNQIYQNYGQYRMPEPTKATVRYAQNGQPKSVFYWSQNETVPAKPTIIQNDAKDYVYKSNEVEPNRSPLPKPHLTNTSTNLRYYADQNPRSRNPIHITCNATPNPSPTNETQTVNASDFWKMKDQESMMKNIQQQQQQLQQQKKTSKPPLTQHVTKDRSGSCSPRPKDLTKSPILQKSRIEPDANRKHLKDEYNASKVNKASPILSVRRNQETKFDEQKNDAKQNNLDDALNELESIYKSLRLGDEDLIERAERRDLPAFRKQTEYNHAVRSTAPSNDYDSDSRMKSNDNHQRAVPLRRSGIPDKVNDDMAYRRMNIKERTDVKKFPARSYLRSSPALSPTPGESPILQKESPANEPDVTYDDVVFRNIRHANSTLKIQDPQPPFGIPIGPITPAPNSDYLHAMPKDRFRPTFMSSKTPDVVKDDLAFRNLRKDNMTANLPVTDKTVSPTNELSSNPNFLIQKKRAVRSLSANLYNIMQKENSGFTPIETNNNKPMEKDSEKTQSLTDLTNDDKNALEKRLKELKDEKNTKRAEFFELSKEQRKKNGIKTKLSWTELANLNGDFENVPQINTSTETLTEEKESKKTDYQKLRVNFPAEDTAKSPERKFRSPVVELSKYPAAAPSSSLYSNPFKETTPGSPLDESQLEDLLSALAIEAKNASDDLSRQLVELELSTVPKPKNCARSIEKEAVNEDNKKKRSSSADKKRKSVSRSNSNDRSEEKKSEKRKEKRSRNNSLKNEERKRKNSQSHSEEAIEVKIVAENEEKKEEVKEDKEQIVKERKKSVNFELVTDLSQILQDVEEQQNLNNEITVETDKKTTDGDIFQEVYEYNCGLLNLNPPKRKKSQPDEIIKVNDEILEILATRSPNDYKTTKDEEITSDIEKEFEKLHDEVDYSIETKETQDNSEKDGFLVVDDLIADITSVSQSGSSSSYSPRPFPKELDERPNGRLASDRKGTTSPSSSSGEGEEKKSGLESNVWLACSYALAFALYLQDLDFLTALGIVLAVISIIAILIL